MSARHSLLELRFADEIIFQASDTVEPRHVDPGRSSETPERSQIIVVLLHHLTISLRAGNLVMASSGTWISLHRLDRSAIQGRSTGSTSAIQVEKAARKPLLGQKADARRSALIVSRRLTIAGQSPEGKRRARDYGNRDYRGNDSARVLDGNR
jgi:hypothetical protein